MEAAPGGIIVDVSDALPVEDLVGHLADPVADALAGLRSGDVRSLARAISAVEDRAEGSRELIAACRAALPAGGERALRIGVTGPPGAGKSTLVDRLVRAFRAQDRTVAVLAVDPSSPFTGGALLGDRIRMKHSAAGEGIYFRSMATRGAVGGLAASAEDVCAVMEAAGRQIIVVETVGAGQHEVQIATLADVILVVLVPGMGDDVQSLKSGMMEIADIFVINKADRDGADQAEAEILAMQSLGEGGAGLLLPPVVRTIATTGQGIDALMERIAAVPRSPRRSIQRQDPLTSSHPQDVHPQDGRPTLDHIGIAVRSIASARSLYASLGLTLGGEETVDREQVRVAMLPLGETRIELLESTADGSTIGRFLAKRGEGLHHLAVRVGDIDALFAQLRAQGVRLAGDRIAIGAGGHRFFFIHPQSAGGVLIEIVEDRDPKPAAAGSSEAVAPSEAAAP